MKNNQFHFKTILPLLANPNGAGYRATRRPDYVLKASFSSLFHRRVSTRLCPLPFANSSFLFRSLSKRYMMSQINIYRRASTQLTRPLLPSYSSLKPQRTYPINRPYAIYSVNNPDKNSPDPQALVNNPPTPHPELHRQRCDLPGCNGAICKGLCSAFKDRKAVAHGTHGNPPKEPGKKVISLSKNTDLKGKPKPQNAVIYDKAHDVGSTAEDVQATTTLHANNANMVQEIKKHEDTQ